MDAAQPFWVGQYRLTSRIATGGMAEVFVGRHITPEGQFGPMVAVKRLLPHLAKDNAIVRMFLNEARITAQIKHPNVVTIFELGQFEGEPFIAMELLEGCTFADLRSRAAEEGKRVPLPIALRVLVDACRGLDAAHRAVDEQGQPLALVHRDFTPDNIHVGVQGDVKVIDFGIAKTSSWGSGTEPGTLKGKFFYMSPEMILAQKVDHRADLFAAGVMLYEQLCGRRPFTGNNIDEVVLKIAQGRPAAPSTYDPSVPPTLEAVCLTALNKNPESRFPTLAEFCDAIEAVGGEAEPASAEVFSAYMAQLFPPQTPKRQTLRRAREADPSMPHLPAMTPNQGLAPAKPAAPAAPSSTKPPAKWPVPVAVIALLALAAGGLVVFRGSTPPAEQRLKEVTLLVGTAQGKALVALAKAPDMSESLYEQAGKVARETQQWEGALALAEGWLLRNPKSGEAKLLEGEAATHLRKAKRAETALREAAAALPDDARPDVAMAELREAQGEVSGAIEAWSRALAKRPQDTHAAARLGYWYSQQGALDEAQKVLEPLLKKQFNAELAAELGFVKFRKSQPNDALHWLERVVKEAPKLMAGHYYLAAVVYQKGDVARARTEYAEADALAPDDSRALFALCELEKQQEAGLELEKVKEKLKARFPAEAARLIARCAP